LSQLSDKTTQYERERIPKRPVLDGIPRSPASIGAVRSVADIRGALDLPSARVAIAMALRHARIPRGATVLLPAYHCMAMVEPVRWAGFRVAFHPVPRDLQLTAHDLAPHLTADVRALVAVHWFGFAQRALPEIDALCRARGVVVVEDCAHALYQRLPAPMGFGEHADYVVASSKKFCPIYDGGVLASRRHDLASVRLRSPGAAFEAKALVNILERGAIYRRLPSSLAMLHTALAAANRLRSRSELSSNAPASPVDAQRASAAADGSQAFEPRWMDTRMSAASRFLSRRVDPERAAGERRRRYARIVEAVARHRWGRALLPQLEADTVPYVVPLWFDEPLGAFARLKARGVPVERFAEDLDPLATRETCAVSHEYSRHVFQLPCHETLTEQDVDWLLAELDALEHSRLTPPVARSP
jgi:perosamine synthetase